MASVSRASSLASPQVAIEGNQLVIRRAVQNTKNVAYDIFITFQSGGIDVAPPADYSQSPTLAQDISKLAQRILDSLPPEIDRENLEGLGFTVQNTADESNPNTAILVSKTAKSVMDSWKRHEVDEYTTIDNPKGILLQYAPGERVDGTRRPSNVHKGLVELRSYLRADSILVLPPSAKKKEPVDDSPAPPPQPNTSISFGRSEVSRPRRRRFRALNVDGEGAERSRTELGAARNALSKIIVP